MMMIFRPDSVIVSSKARVTDGIAFYAYQFDNPLDQSIPRTGSKANRPTRQVELYELCVSKGKLWNLQITVKIFLLKFKNKK